MVAGEGFAEDNAVSQRPKVIDEKNDKFRFSMARGSLIRWCSGASPSLLIGPSGFLSFLNINDKQFEPIDLSISVDVSSIECSNEPSKLRMFSPESKSIVEFETKTQKLHDIISVELRPRRVSPVFAFSPDGKYIANNDQFAKLSPIKPIKLVSISGVSPAWSQSSDKVLSIIRDKSYQDQIEYQDTIEIVDLKVNTTYKRRLPKNMIFVSGAFTESEKEIIIFMKNYFAEEREGVIFRCRIEIIDCRVLSINVVDASFGGSTLFIASRTTKKYNRLNRKKESFVEIVTMSELNSGKKIAEFRYEYYPSSRVAISKSGLFVAYENPEKCLVSGLSCQIVSVERLGKDVR